MQSKRKAKENKPVFIVKSMRMGGLDYLHVSLIALVVILIALAFALAYFKPGNVLVNCPYGIVNGTCSAAQHNSTEVMHVVGRILAGYAGSNSSLSLLAYYSLPNMSSVSYVPSTGGWLVVVPYRNPFQANQTLNVSFVLSRNLTLQEPFLSMVMPGSTNDSTVAFGTVSLSGKSLCAYSGPMPVYFMTDPYVPGFINYTEGAIALASQYSGSVNMSYYFIPSSYSLAKYSQYGLQETQGLNRYLDCASRQSGFGAFVSNLSKSYDGNPMSNSTLHGIALESGLDPAQLSSCMDNVTSSISAQTTLAAFYGVRSLPAYIVNCGYASIPNTARYAINYALGSLPKR